MDLTKHASVSSSSSSSSSVDYWASLEQEISTPLILTNSCFSVFGSVFIILCQIFVTKAFSRSNLSDTSTSTTRPSPLHQSLVFGLTVAHLFLATEWIVSIALAQKANQSTFDRACRYMAPFKFYNWIVILLYVVFIGLEIVYRYRNIKVSSFDETILTLSFPIRKRYVHAAIVIIPLPSLPLLAIFDPPMRNKEQCWWDPTFNNPVSYALEIAALATWLCCCVCYIYTLILYKMKLEGIGSRRHIEDEKMKNLLLRMTSYLLVFLLLWGPLFLAEAYVLLPIWRMSGFPIVINLVLSSLRPLTGFFNAIVYGFEPGLWKKLKEKVVWRRTGENRALLKNVQEEDSVTEDDKLIGSDYSTPTYDMYSPGLGIFSAKRTRADG